MKTPTLIGAIIFVISLMVAVIAILRLDFVVQLLEGEAAAQETQYQREYFELFFIWICGVVGGLGLGYGSREGFGYDESNAPTIIGGLGLGGVIVIPVLMLVQGTPPVQGVGATFISAIFAIIGLYMTAVSTQESY